MSATFIFCSDYRFLGCLGIEVVGWRGCSECNYSLSNLARDVIYCIVFGYSLYRCDCYRIGFNDTGTENQASPITGIADIVSLCINLESRDNLFRLIRNAWIMLLCSIQNFRCLPLLRGLLYQFSQLEFHQFASTDRHRICLFLGISQLPRLSVAVFEDMWEV